MIVILMPWLEFAFCAALIGMAGPLLTHYGDVMARLTGLSRSWIGLMLLATATSLPELFTGISSVTDVPAHRPGPCVDRRLRRHPDRRGRRALAA
jgi:Ca2+/Na+ antiporter